MHRQPDDIWRIDLQLGPDADAIAEQEPQRVRARLDKVLKPHAYELEWVSIYTFNCRRLDRFVHDRVIFIGDAAHQVSPFGARGANSGIQDAENLAWKLAAVLKGEGGRSVDRKLRSRAHPGRRREYRHIRRARPISCRRIRTPNGGCATPCWRSRPKPSSPAAWSIPAGCRCRRFTIRRCRLPTQRRLPARQGSARRCPTRRSRRADGAATHLLESLRGEFELIYVKDGDGNNGAARRARSSGIALTVIGEDFFDREGKFTQRFDATPGAAYLVRPDQHLCARWRSFDAAAMARAHRRACRGEADGEARHRFAIRRSRCRLSRARGSAAEPPDAEAAELDTRLVLILANHIGDLDVLSEAIALAKGNKLPYRSSPRRRGPRMRA